MSKNKSNEMMDWLKIFIIALLFTLIVRLFIFSPVLVDGESMLPTLEDRDRMIVNKITYKFKEPDRFDIVIFHAPDERDFVKRVIGLPGEHIEVNDNTLYVDGEEMEQPFMNSEENAEITFPNITEDFTFDVISQGNYDVIPEGYVLVLGDNRRHSRDSRDHTIGLVDMDEIVGKTNIIYWPLKRIQYVKE